MIIDDEHESSNAASEKRVSSDLDHTKCTCLSATVWFVDIIFADTINIQRIYVARWWHWK